MPDPGQRGGVACQPPMRRIVTSTYRYKRPPRKRKGPARISRPGRAATDPEPCRAADSPAGRFPRR